jgi:hypothetical protein
MQIDLCPLFQEKLMAIPPLQRPVNAQATNQASDSSILRRRIQAELAEIRDELQQSHLRERNVGPVAELIAVWLEDFHRLVRPPVRGEVMPDLGEAIRLFREQLENLLADPINEENPYPPQLFGELPTRIVRFMVAKAINRNSVLFSQRIYDAKPSPPAPPVIPENFEEQLRMINALRMQRMQEEEQQMPGLQELMGELRQIEVRQDENLAAIGERFRVAIAPIAAAIREMEANVPRQRERLLAAIERQQERQEGLTRGLAALERDRRQVREGIDEQRRADLDLRISTNRLEQSIEQKKQEYSESLFKSGGLLALSMIVTWAASSYYPGTSIHFMNPQYPISINFVF